MILKGQLAGAWSKLMLGSLDENTYSKNNVRRLSMLRLSQLCCGADCWVWTYFSWPCVVVCRSGQVNFGFGGNQSRLPYMGTGKLTIMSWMLRLVLLKPQWVIPSGFNPLQRGLRYPFLGECWLGLRHFWSYCLVLLSFSWWDVQQILP